ncbi:hypothetical protein Ssi02_77720 [Sinosporangium siamense]|uniref:Uncharacterized protein n=1 Tax=Sinosporangium siamense TaxID=1367973 RepID=A0A919RS51_9ACTN|nr:hypothetical protein Ssi02_77720 [Sinosporangium siamense]
MAPLSVFGLGRLLAIAALQQTLSPGLDEELSGNGTNRGEVYGLFNALADGLTQRVEVLRCGFHGLLFLAARVRRQPPRGRPR